MNDHEFGQGDFSDYLSQTSIFEQEKSEQKAATPTHAPLPPAHVSLGWEGRIGLSLIGALTMVLVCLICFRISQALRRAEPKMTPPKVVRDFSPARLASKAVSLQVDDLAREETPSPAARLSFATESSASSSLTAKAAPSNIPAAGVGRASDRASGWSPRPHAANEAASYEQALDALPPPLPPPDLLPESVERGKISTEATPAPRVQATPKQLAQPPQLAPGAAYSARRYLVQAGDTLPAIAQRELGERRRWLEIWQLNTARLEGGLSRLQPGVELVLPAKITTTARTPRAGKRREYNPRAWR